MTDARGRHIARSPVDASLIGADFSYRDYFHGRGRDLEPGSERRTPITAPHRSVVFQSKANQKLIVAFSVPIWSSEDADDREVLGILAMSVELGNFAALSVEVAGEQVAVLVDVRSDWLDGTEGRGLILHHPRLDGVRRLGSDLLAELAAARTREDPSVMRQDYADPFAPGEPWLVVYEPVVVRGRTDRQRDVGWVVGVQERASGWRRSAR